MPCSQKAGVGESYGYPLLQLPGGWLQLILGVCLLTLGTSLFGAMELTEAGNSFRVFMYVSFMVLV